MAVLSTQVATYADVAKRLDSTGALGGIVEILNRTNPMLDDMLTKEANDGTGNRTTVRTGIPQAAWRILNYGVPRVKTTTASVRDTSGMLEVYAEVDKKLADMSGDQKAFRLSEAKGIMEGMSQQMASTVIYGNTLVNPERFTGLAPRYSTLDSSVPSSKNVRSMGGTDPTSNTSIWLITWGENATHAFYPKHSQAGLQHQDLGEHTLVDPEGGQYQGYRDHFSWDIGLSVRDWRTNARICNIDTDLLNDATYVKNLIRMMIDVSEELPISNEDTNADGGRRVWYMPKVVRSALRWGILEKLANNMTWDTWQGKRVMMFDDTPVRRSDAILTTEAIVV